MAYFPFTDDWNAAHQIRLISIVKYWFIGQQTMSNDSFLESVETLMIEELTERYQLTPEQAAYHVQNGIKSALCEIEQMKRWNLELFPDDGSKFIKPSDKKEQGKPTKEPVKEEQQDLSTILHRPRVGAAA